MGFNILGVVLSKQFENKVDLCKTIGIGDVELITSEAIFENGSSSYGMGDTDVYITEVGRGTIITYGVQIDFTQISVKALTQNEGKGMVFVTGDTIGLYHLFYCEDGKGKRSLNYSNGSVVDNRGNKLAVETEDKDIQGVIFDLIPEITGVRFWDIEPDHPSQLFRRK